MGLSRERDLRTSYDPESSDLLENSVFYNSLTQEEVDDMENLAYKMQAGRKFVDEHQHEITTLLSNSDWLEVYSKSVLDFGVDMNHFIHSTEGAPVEARQDWNELAEFAKYIRNINNEQINHKDYEKLIQFMAKNDQGTDEISRESIFRGLIKEQNDIDHA